MRDTLGGFVALLNNKLFATVTGLIGGLAAYFDLLEQWLEIGIALCTFILVAWNVHDRIRKAIMKRRGGNSADSKSDTGA